MIDRCDEVREVVEQLVPHVVGGNDWPDVVNRAESRHLLKAPALRGRLRNAALVALAGLIIGVPALAATGTLQELWQHRGPELGLSALLRDPAGRAGGSFQAALPGVFATENRPHHLLPHRMLHRGGLRPATSYPLQWRVELPHGPALSGRVVYKPGVAHAGTTIVELCRPCRSNATGEVVLTRAQAALLLNGQLALSFQTEQGTLRGVVPSTTQRGLIPRSHG